MYNKREQQWVENVLTTTNTEGATVAVREWHDSLANMY